MLESGHELSARFVLVRALGAGGSGAVWLAQDRDRNRFVAVKVLADHLMQDVGGLAALKLECDRVRILQHPGILPVDGLYRSPRYAWIAMDYAADGDLSRFRARPAVEILRAVMPIAGALAHAHRAGLVHRDVKPTNVVLTSDGPKLTDFGIALAVAELPAPHMSSGSPFTASPQQLDRQPATPADDIYSFGAMLYELLSGYPPFYPDATPERVRTEAPAALPATVPASVAALVMRCLAKSPTERPADMDAVERELSAALAELPPPAAIDTARPLRVEPPGLRAPMRQGAPLRSEWQRTTGAEAVDAAALRRQGFRRGLGAALLVLAIVGVIGVFVVLPKWVATNEPASYTQAPSPRQPEAPRAEKKEVDLAALARAKQAAEEAREPLDDRIAKLRARAVEQWGGEDYATATAEVSAGDTDFAAREFESAAAHFANVPPLLVNLEKKAGEVFAARLEAGEFALKEGRSADARIAFDTATKIDPKHAGAARGLKRAGTLDQVLELVAAGERAEKDGNLTGATENFHKAIALDAAAPRAPEGIARIQSRIAGDAFASAMARGFSALAKADYAGARSGFEDAGKIRPSAPEVAQALQQIEQEQRTKSIAQKLAEAADFESKERWDDALRQYQSIVDLDATMATAKEGVARVTPRAQLNQELDLYMTQPERLFSQAVRAGAKSTLSRAASIPSPGPMLTKQIATLRQWLARADVPVQIALQSDNVTQVTLYRVGTLGAFEQRSLELAPGNYTIVGTRPGYRDVRREISVVPGAPLPPVVIRCEDKI